MNAFLKPLVPEHRETCMHCHRSLPKRELVSLRFGAWRCADRLECATAADYPIQKSDFDGPTAEEFDINEATPRWRR